MPKRKLLLISALAAGVASSGLSCTRQAPLPPVALVADPPAGKTPDGAATPNTGAVPDRASKLVGDTLRPSDEAGALPWRDYQGQRPLLAPAGLEKPQLPLPSTPISVPRAAPMKVAAPPQPTTVAEELPQLPRQSLPALRSAEPVTVALRRRGPNLDEPPPLPLLASYQPDRTPLADATAEASRASILAKTPSLRAEPAPFIPWNLPDPFENRDAIRLANTPAEDPNPPAPVVRKPGS
jgi:hypothetical protein